MWLCSPGLQFLAQRKRNAPTEKTCLQHTQHTSLPRIIHVTGNHFFLLQDMLSCYSVRRRQFTAWSRAVSRRRGSCTCLSPRSLSPTRRSAHCDDTCTMHLTHIECNTACHVGGQRACCQRSDHSWRSCTALQENVIAEVLRPHVSGALSGCLGRFSTLFTSLFVISVHGFGALVICKLAS